MHQSQSRPRLASAELAYVFRHALLREAAYQLQPPSERAALHGVAFGVLESTLKAMDDHMLSVNALELADHAALGKALRPELEAAELHYLCRAYDLSRERHALRDTVTILDRMLAHPQLPEQDRDVLTGELGLMLLNTGNAARSRELLQPLAERLRKEGKREALARALTALALLNLQLGNPQACEEVYAELIPLAAETGDPYMEMSARLNYGSMLLDLDRLDEGWQLLEEARDIAARRRFARAHAQAETNLAFIALRRGDLQGAEAQYLRGLAMAEASGALGSRLNALMHLSTILEQTGRRDEAEARLKQTHKLALETGMRRYQSSSLGALAGLAWRVGRREEAFELIEKALDIARQSRNVRLSGIWRCRLAVFLALDGKRERAEAEWQAAVRDLQRAGLHALAEEQTGDMVKHLREAGLEPLV